MGELRRLLAIFPAFTAVLLAGDNFEQRLTEGRAQYFAYLQGNRSAGDKARATFTTLSHDYPGNSVVDADSGRLHPLGIYLSFYKRREQAVSDFTYIAPRAEALTAPALAAETLLTRLRTE